MNNYRQSGFTLVEIAIVLVIIGLLLGGILKGQELINSARVRNLADQNSGIQAAYYGFIDRYRQVPGDMDNTQAQNAIAVGGVTINGGGNGNGKIDEADWEEAAALWEHLAKAGFIQGSFDGTATNESSYSAAGNAPVNAFNGTLLLARNEDYTEIGSSPAKRLNLHLGDNIPVNIARELDVKVDDGRPNAGVMREAGDTVTDFSSVNASTSANCQTDATASDSIYDIQSDAQNCNLAFLY